MGPILETEIYLALLYLLSIFTKYRQELAIHEISRLIAVSIGIYLPFLIFRKQSPRLANLFITVFILLLLADQKTPWFLMLALGSVTAVIKIIVRSLHQPIFNPAAAGLLVTSLIGVTTTWWGVSFSPRLHFYNMSLAMLLTLPVGLYLIWLYKKLPTLIFVPSSFALTYFLLTGRSPLTILLEGTFAFFLFIIVTEPRTTPVINRQEAIFGAFLGSMLAFLFKFRFISSPYLISLLTANLLFAIMRKISSRTPTPPKGQRQNNW